MRKRSTVVILSLIAAVSLFAQEKRVTVGGPPPEMKNWPKPDVRTGLSQSETLSSIAGFVQKLYDTNHFSGVILVAKEGKPLLTRAWGLANVASKTPNTVDTKFNIGSINKIFTKTAIAQLAAAGKLSLDDTVRKHLPDYPSPVADRITIDQLIHHRSGLGDFFGPRYEAAPPSRLRELSDFLELFADEPLQFEPGTSQRYSNAGYIVLGLIIERITGQTYRQYVQQHVFEPAGMKDTGLWAIDEDVPNRVTGYTMHGPDRDYEERRPNVDSLPGRPSSAGGAYATAGDLLRFLNALESKKLVSPKWTNWVLGDSFEDQGKAALGIAGGAPGLNTALETGQGWVVIAMSNFDPPAAMAVARGATQIIHGKKDDEREDGGPMIRRAPSAPDDTRLGGPVSVPMTQVRHLPVIEAKVNGQGPYHFAIDSGAAGLMRISTALQKTLGLTVVGEVMVGDPSLKNMQRRPIVHIDSVEVGDGHFGGIEAVVSDNPETDGVIGLHLFGDITVTIDYPRSQVRLGLKALPASDPHVVPFTTERGIPEIGIDIAGVPVKVDVDTGSPALLSIPASWTKRFPFDGEPRVVGHGRTSTNEFDIRAADLKGDLRVAGYTESNPRVDIVDLFPVANLGSRFLSEYAVTFDMPNGRMALAK